MTTEPEGLPGVVRTRIGPSPTGEPHVGTAYQAIYDLAAARHSGDGRFICRIEDTDRARQVAGAEDQVIELVRGWLNLPWDEGPDVGGPAGPYRQSERLALYGMYARQLVDTGHAYYCWCTPQRLAEMRAAQQERKQPTGYDRLCFGKTRAERAALTADGGPALAESPVIRLAVPADVQLTFTDLIRGETSAPKPDDQVILKADGYPTYHLAVVVDDHLMGITVMVRGEEWISSTPKQLLLYQALGWTPPDFAHTPTLRNADKTKISKRKNPWSRLSWFRDEGYLPEALVNFLCLMAYPPALADDGTEVEVFDLDDFVRRFDWQKINPVGPYFDLKKLDWMNGVYLRKLPTSELAERLIPVLSAAQVLPATPSDEQRQTLLAVTEQIQTRLSKLSEAVDQVRPFFVADADLELLPEAVAKLDDQAPQILQAATAALASVDQWQASEIESALRAALIAGLQLKPKTAFTPLRVAVSGRLVSPPLFESMEILGRGATLIRLRRLLTDLAAAPSAETSD